MENKRNLLESEVDLKDLIVIDNGTDSIKMGYSGENHPRVNQNTFIPNPINTISNKINIIANLINIFPILTYSPIKSINPLPLIPPYFSLRSRSIP